MMEPSEASQSRPIVMLVDDEPDILVALEDLLGDEYRLLAETSPVKALARLEGERDVAVILSDQRMPEMPGHLFLARARALCQAEALLLTGHADIDAVIAAVNEGRIGGYAHKPWEAEALRAMVAAAVERHQLRRALAFERAALGALIASSRDCIGVFDGDGRLLRGAAGDGGDQGAERAADQAALASGEARDEEHRETGADGLPRFRRIQRLPFVADGRHHLLKIESDESERRQLEQRLQQSEKLRALGTLAGGIAHDFNNLLTAITGNLELAARRAEEPGLARFIRNADEAARRGASLTNRLLSFSRQGDAAAGSAIPNRLVAGMEELIARTTSGLVTPAFDLAPEAWAARVDPDQLELAILNLAINARDAMPEGGTVRIATRNVALPPGGPLPAGDYVTIAVGDEGEGMSDEIAQRVFEPFFTTKERGRGTGLGLPMVNAMAENAGGRVALQTAPGEGTTVTIWLPRDEGPIDTADPEGAPARCRPLRILLVEDDADVRAVSEAYLGELGHAVITAESGEAALARFDGGQFDLVMTDFVMPGLSGLQIADAIEARRPGTPVLLVTGFAEVGALPGQVTTLRKPFTRSALAEALAARFPGEG